MELVLYINKRVVGRTFPSDLFPSQRFVWIQLVLFNYIYTLINSKLKSYVLGRGCYYVHLCKYEGVHRDPKQSL